MAKHTIRWVDRDGKQRSVTGTVQANGDLIDKDGRVWRVIATRNVTGGAK